MDAACVKKALIEEIKAISESPKLYCHDPTRDFSRNRKLPFATLVSLILHMNGGSLTNELLDYFSFRPDAASSSAFVQQRNKLKAETFRQLLLSFNKHMEKLVSVKTLGGLRLLAIDGSDIQTPTNPNDQDSYFPGANGQRPYNVFHLNALYDLLQNTYVDAVVQKRRDWYECGALVEMVEDSSIGKALVVGDRGYESYNVMAHIHEKGWFFLFRVRETQGLASGLDLPDTDEFDLDISLNITRCISKEVKELIKDKNHYRYIPQNSNLDYLPRLNGKHQKKPVFYNLNFRIVRITIAEGFIETLVTNLPVDDYPPDKLKHIYNMRWGIETLYQYLKNKADFNDLMVQDYYKEQGLSFIMLVTGQIHQKMIAAIKKLDNNAISVHDILLMARCMKMERRGNNWNLRNARKRDLQILKQMGFEPKIMVADS